MVLYSFHARSYHQSMRTFSYQYHNSLEFNKALMSDAVFSQAAEAQGVLVQIFSGNIDPDFCLALAKTVKYLLPSAVIIGSTSTGEILQGQVFSLSVQISISLFDTSSIHSIFLQADEKPICENVIIEAVSPYRKPSQPNQALLLSTTPITVDSDLICATLSALFPDICLMGGGAGDNGAMEVAYVFNELEVSDSAALMIFMQGHELSIVSHAHLYWQPIGKVMTITHAEGKRLYTIDGEPAFDVYARYFGLEYNESDFFSEVLEFPLLLHRGGNLLARVPVYCDVDGSLLFISDVKTGDKVQIGFGAVDVITTSTQRVLNKFLGLPIESLFVYSCGCRRFLLQEDTVRETEGLKNIAHTSGFFTVGEFYRDERSCDVLNLTFTAYGITEQPLPSRGMQSKQIDNLDMVGLQTHQMGGDLYDSKHLRILNKLSTFLNATTEELQQALDKSDSAGQAKTQFLANISHELRTPLASIMGYAELIKRNEMDEADRIKAADIIVKNGAHVTSIIDDILEFSKVDSQQLKLVESEVNVPSFIFSLQEMLLPLIEGRPIKFSIDAVFPLPKMIKTDALRLRQILINLLNNAAKFTESGFIILQLSYDFKLQRLLVSVEDSGKGIKLEQLGQMFQPFEQLDVQNSRMHGGAGLGLSISRKLALLLGGDIQVDSKEGVGSCFSCDIQAPITSAEIIDDEDYWQQSTQQQIPLLTQQRQYSLNVLLAEDHQDNRELFKRMLTDLGCKVVAVENGQQALNASLVQQFELILLDIQMPVMDGIEALEKLKALENTVPVVAITANVLRSDIEMYFELGFAGHLAKPVSTIELTGLINAYAKGRPAAVIKTLHYADLDQQYLDSLPSIARVMRHFFSVGLFASLADEAHKLRGSAVHFCHPHLEVVATDIELGLKQKDDVHVIAALDAFDDYLRSLTS